MKNNKILASMAILAMISCSFGIFVLSTNDAYAATSTDEMWEYTPEGYSPGTLDLTKYLGDDRDVVIPNKIDDLYVLRLMTDLFTPESAPFIESVIIPDSVIYVGMRSISNTLITEIDIPSGVTVYAGGALWKNANLEKITVSELNTKYYAFNDCLYSYEGTLMKVPEALTDNISIEPGTTKILNYAFSHTQTTSVTLPATLVEIGSSASLTNIVDVYLEKGTTVLPEYGSWNDNVVFHKHYTDEIEGIPGGATVKEYAIVSYGGKTDYVETGTAADQPVDVSGIQTTYYTDAAKTEEYDWAELVTEDIVLYTVSEEVLIDGKWRVIFIDEEGAVISESFVNDGEQILSVPAGEYSWYIDVEYGTLFDWKEPVTGHTLVYGKTVAEVIDDADEPVKTVSTTLLLIVGSVVLGIITVYMRNPYVAILTVVVAIFAILFYTEVLPLDLSNLRSYLLW